MGPGLRGLARIVEDKPDDASARHNLGYALLLQGKIDEAIAAYRRRPFA